MDQMVELYRDRWILQKLC